MLVHDEYHNRRFWKVAWVEKLIEGSDGQVRGAVIRVHSRGMKTMLLRRPLKCLYPLEISCKMNDIENAENVKSDPRKNPQSEVVSPRTPPPKRAAAQRAEQWMRTVLDDEDV